MSCKVTSENEAFSHIFVAYPNVQFELGSFSALHFRFWAENFVYQPFSEAEAIYEDVKKYYMSWSGLSISYT